MKKKSLSVAIITKNEEINLRSCLQSIHFAAQVVIIDSGSTDKTLDIAKNMVVKFTARLGKVLGGAKTDCN